MARSANDRTVLSFGQAFQARYARIDNGVAHDEVRVEFGGPFHVVAADGKVRPAFQAKFQYDVGDYGSQTANVAIYMDGAGHILRTDNLCDDYNADCSFAKVEWWNEGMPGPLGIGWPMLVGADGRIQTTVEGKPLSSHVEVTQDESGTTLRFPELDVFSDAPFVSISKAWARYEPGNLVAPVEMEFEGSGILHLMELKPGGMLDKVPANPTWLRHNPLSTFAVAPFPDAGVDFMAMNVTPMEAIAELRNQSSDAASQLDSGCIWRFTMRPAGSAVPQPLRPTPSKDGEVHVGVLVGTSLHDWQLSYQSNLLGNHAYLVGPRDGTIKPGCAAPRAAGVPTASASEAWARTLRLDPQSYMFEYVVRETRPLEGFGNYYRGHVQTGESVGLPRYLEFDAGSGRLSEAYLPVEMAKTIDTALAP